uniref:Uncharacterized protein n=1 Tax=Leersia perrieri TaxID=77586 RepID=A0A0D9V3I2_9ORYZ
MATVSETSYHVQDSGIASFAVYADAPCRSVRGRMAETDGDDDDDDYDCAPAA